MEKPVVVEGGQHLFHRVVDEVFELKLVGVVRVAFWQLAEFFGEVETGVDVLGRDEVPGHFDAAVQVEHLCRCAHENDFDFTSQQSPLSVRMCVNV